MKFVLRAAMTALSIATIPPAIAGGGIADPSTVLTELPGAIAQVPVQNAPSIATAHGGQADIQPGHGPWLFPPIGKYLDQRAGG